MSGDVAMKTKYNINIIIISLIWAYLEDRVATNPLGDGASIRLLQSLELPLLQ